MDVERRIHAVNAFNRMDESEALAAANKRVGNILAKSDVDLTQATIQKELLNENAEQVLYEQIIDSSNKVTQLIEQKNYEAALSLLAKLRNPVDNFFDSVMVNVDDVAIKTNRLLLLTQLRQLFLNIADISLLQK